MSGGGDVISPCCMTLGLVGMTLGRYEQRKRGPKCAGLLRLLVQLSCWQV